MHMLRLFFAIWLSLSPVAAYALNSTARSRESFHALQNRDGWIDPEDIPSMPQCIAQQERSDLVDAMSRCSGKRCVRHFWFICTRHLWLTELECLSVEISSGFLERYYNYCSRSVLAKTQLYLWIRKVTGRSWLVNEGDTIGLDDLSPGSLVSGYTSTKTILKAPECLRSSLAFEREETFSRIVASCSFTETTRHTGNADRPWEYSGSSNSLVSHDSEIVGYDLAQQFWQRSLEHDEYFDIGCFCATFTWDMTREPCSDTRNLDWTKGRLWMTAICGKRSVPENIPDGIRTIGSAYFPADKLGAPECVRHGSTTSNQPFQRCLTDACQLDDEGFCIVSPAIDRACLCRNIQYETFADPCKDFEARIGYVHWLWDICGDLPDWHGLPANWHQLAAPTRLEMVPWRWTIEPSYHTRQPPGSQHISHQASSECPSNAGIVWSMLLANAATVLAARCAVGFKAHRATKDAQQKLARHSSSLAALCIIAAQVIVCWVNVLVVKTTDGFDDIPMKSLMALWISMPRIPWPVALLAAGSPSAVRRGDSSAMDAFISAEVVLQLLAAYTMLVTFSYGWEHHFYPGMERLSEAPSAILMYTGALIWFVVVATVVIVLLRQLHGGKSQSLEQIIYKNEDRRPLLDNSRNQQGWYSTFGNAHSLERAQPFSIQGLYALCSGLFFAQWLFWGGFVYLSSNHYCIPNLSIITMIWIASSVASVVLVF